MFHTRTILQVLACFLLCLSLPVPEIGAADPSSSAYGIHLSSFREEGRAAEQVAELEKGGAEAFFMPVFIPDSGQWFRVFAGARQDKAGALREAESLQEKGIVREYTVVRIHGIPGRPGQAADVPASEGFAVHIASFRDEGRARERVAELRDAGYPAFSKAFTSAESGEWRRVFAGPRDTRDGAESMARNLQSHGIVDSYSIMEVGASPARDTGRPVPSEPLREVPSRDRPEPKPVTPSPEPERAPPMETTATADPAAESLRTRKDQIERDSPDQVRHQPQPIRETLLFEDPPLSMEAGPARFDGPQDDPPDDPPDDPVNWQEDAEERHPPLREAMAYFRTENYRAAQERFRVILKDNAIDGRVREFVARRDADCAFELALEADRPRMMAALDQYRDILRRYPDSPKGNDQILIRMGEGYLALGLYQEALRELSRLVEQYPQSSHLAQAFYLRGELHHRRHRYGQAIEELEQHLKHSPEGEHAKSALLMLADSYSHQERHDEANQAYRQLLQLWSGLESMPQENLLALGSHYLRSGDYDTGLEVFLTWFNLYPEGSQAAEVLHGSGRILASQGQVPAALALLALVIEWFPESRQASESKIIMADLGLRSPDRGLPSHIFDGMKYYLDPVKAYDEVLSETTDRNRRDELMFLRSEALMQLKRYQEAFDTARMLQAQSPWGPFRRENAGNILGIAAYLINEHYVAGDYLDAADVFLKVRRRGFIQSTDQESLFRAGRSLVMIGLSSTARPLFEEIASRQGPGTAAAMAELAMMDLELGAYGNARSHAASALERAASTRESPPASALEVLGELAFRGGEYGPAAAYFADLAEGAKDPALRAGALMRQAHALRNQGSYWPALAASREALQVVESSGLGGDRHMVAAALGGIGETYHQLGRHDNSIAFHSRVMEATEDRIDTLWSLYRLGQAYLHRGDVEKADQAIGTLRERADDAFWRLMADYGHDYQLFYTRYGDLAVR